jgi:hypothetical protein
MTIKQYKALTGPERTPETVPGEEIKLKGYAQFRFFAYKDQKFWFVHELTTGACVQEGKGQHTTLPEAKRAAREYLAHHSEGNKKVIADKLAEFDNLNTKVNS